MKILLMVIIALLFDALITLITGLNQTQLQDILIVFSVFLALYFGDGVEIKIINA